MNKYKGRIGQVQGIMSRFSLTSICLPRNIQVRSLVAVFVLSVLVAGCAGSQAIQPGMLEASTGMSSSLQLEQEIPKSNDSMAASSMTGNSPPEGGKADKTSNDPGIVPDETSQESNNADPAFVTPAVPPAIAPTEPAVPPQAQSPVDLSIPVGPQIGNRAPDFTLQTLDGLTIALSDLLGRPVVINYWATWCVPCKEELPILEKLFQEYQSRGLLIISVDAIEQDTTEKLQSVINQKGMTFPTLLDEGNQFANAYQAIFFPTSFFIDASGVIRDMILGDSSEDVFRQKIEGLLSGGF